MSAGNDLELYYSLEVMTTANANAQTYVFLETGLTNETIYNNDDLIFTKRLNAKLYPSR